MSEETKSLRKLNDKEVINIFVRYLADNRCPELRVDCCPDERNRQNRDIDAIAGCFAIEHTSIDTVPYQRRDSAWFIEVVRPLEREFLTLSFRLNLMLPNDGIQSDQDWDKIRVALRSWISSQSSKLDDGFHKNIGVPDIPFKFHAIKKNSARNRIIFSRTAPSDPDFPKRLRKDLDKRINKLIPYKKKNKTTILLVESSDFALMNDALMRDGIRSAFPGGLPQGLDEIWYADTSIPEGISFSKMI